MGVGGGGRRRMWLAKSDAGLKQRRRIRSTCAAPPPNQMVYSPSSAPDTRRDSGDFASLQPGTIVHIPAICRVEEKSAHIVTVNFGSGMLHVDQMTRRKPHRMHVYSIWTNPNSRWTCTTPPIPCALPESPAEPALQVVKRTSDPPQLPVTHLLK
jgi:hypothetical protein